MWEGGAVTRVGRTEREGSVPSRGEIYRAGGRLGFDKVKLEIFGLSVVTGMVDIEVREHPRGGAARDGHLGPAVQAGAQTGARVSDPENYPQSQLGRSWRK